MNAFSFLRRPSFSLLLIQGALAYEWILGGWGKLSGGVFVGGMAKTLARFETGNPHTTYVGTFLRLAQGRPELFGQLVQWGELLAGIGLLVGILLFLFAKTSSLKRWALPVSVLSLGVGAFMNANFYYAAGWTSASTGGLNGFMFWTQVALLVFWVGASRREGADK